MLSHRPSFKTEEKGRQPGTPNAEHGSEESPLDRCYNVALPTCRSVDLLFCLVIRDRSTCDQERSSSGDLWPSGEGSFEPPLHLNEMRNLPLFEYALPRTEAQSFQRDLYLDGQLLQRNPCRLGLPKPCVSRLSRLASQVGNDICDVSECVFRESWAVISRDLGHAFHGIAGSHFTIVGRLVDKVH